jgi:hypothetical protein
MLRKPCALDVADTVRSVGTVDAVLLRSQCRSRCCEVYGEETERQRGFSEEGPVKHRGASAAGDVKVDKLRYRIGQAGHNTVNA